MPPVRSLVRKSGADANDEYMPSWPTGESVMAYS